MALALVDLVTGEALDVIDEGDSVKIVRSSQMEYIAETEGYSFSSFVKVNIEELEYLVKELRPNEISFLLALLTCMAYKDNCIKSKNGRPLSVSDIAERFGMSRKKASEMVNVLMEQDIIARAKNSVEYQLYVNPWIAGRGNRCNKVLATMFRHYKVKSRGGIQWGKLKV